ncbi:MAG: ATP-binding cassette domain-containing protein [Verrucomicrobiales bacterium]
MRKSVLAWSSRDRTRCPSPSTRTSSSVYAHTPKRELKRNSNLDDIVEGAAPGKSSSGDTTRNRLKDRATSLTLEQQQKLCIARLLPLKPQVILMDEPCSALDADGIERVEELIFQLRQNFTIVMVTQHNMGQAKRASDECIFMLLGKSSSTHPPRTSSSIRKKKTAMCISRGATVDPPGPPPARREIVTQLP